jgi:hypothetical protein
VADDELEQSRRAFEAKVRATPAPRPPAPGGKGSPGALLITGVIGTAMLAIVAALVGGGVLYVPAALPLATVVAVLAARRLADRR